MRILHEFLKFHETKAYTLVPYHPTKCEKRVKHFHASTKKRYPKMGFDKTLIITPRSLCEISTFCASVDIKGSEIYKKTTSILPKMEIIRAKAKQGFLGLKSNLKSCLFCQNIRCILLYPHNSFGLNAVLYRIFLFSMCFFVWIY